MGHQNDSQITLQTLPDDLPGGQDEYPMLPYVVRCTVAVLAHYVKDETDDWNEVKRTILRTISSPDHRRLFSRVSERTAIREINDFEREVIRAWRALTHVQLIVRQPSRRPNSLLF